MFFENCTLIIMYWNKSKSYVRMFCNLSLVIVFINKGVFPVHAKLDSIPYVHYSFHAREPCYIIFATWHWLASLQV
ncbi:hypothetical protein Btru_070575 [Bulinus truncatus]|nr:hypothetical protein Btru_070575 [Bulinus truncatus]